MRLIDADEFENYVRKHCKDSLADLWCELIRRQSTAYDVNKVIERLEELHETISCDDWYAAAKVYHAIVIIKKGGIN